MSRYLPSQVNAFPQSGVDIMSFWDILFHTHMRKEPYELKKQTNACFDSPSVWAVLTVLAVIVELGRYPGCLFAVAPDDVEVRQQVEGNLHKELKAEQGQDTEVDVGQLGRKGLAAQVPGRLGHLFPRLTEDFARLGRQERAALPVAGEWSRSSLAEPSSRLVQTK